MESKRVNSTSFRFTNEFKKVVNSCPGQTFADKVDYAVLNYIKESQKRKNEIKNLDSEIDKRKKGLASLNKKLSKMESVFNSLDTIKYQVDKILKETSSKVSDDNAIMKDKLQRLQAENLELKKQIKEPQIIKIGAFKKDRVNNRPEINVFVDWIGYYMFAKNNDDTEEYKLCRRIYDKYIKPTYYEFCETCKGNTI